MSKIANIFFKQNKSVYIIIVFCFVGANFLYYVYFFTNNGYLPSPFLNDKSDTFMDLFNTMYWTYNPGRYTEWGSVYPPINFLLLKIINFLGSGELSGLAEFMRDNSTFVIILFCSFYLTIPAIVLSMRQWNFLGLIDKIFIYCISIFSSPMLFALERGNLVIFCVLILSFVVTKIGFIRSFSIAILINLKPYFAIFLLYYLIRRDYKGFFYASLLSGFIYFACGLYLDEHFILFLANIVNFSQDQELFSVRELLSFPASISVFSKVLGNPEVALSLSKFLDFEFLNLCIKSIEIGKYCVILISLGIAFVKGSSLRDSEIFALLTVIITNLGIWVGGYTLIFYIVLIPALCEMKYKIIYISFLALMLVPLDLITIISNDIGIQYSFLSDSLVQVHWSLGLGSITRPLLNFLLLLFILFEFLRRNYRGNLTSGVYVYCRPVINFFSKDFRYFMEPLYGKKS